MSPLTGPTSNRGWSPTSSMAGLVVPASGPEDTSTLSASTAPALRLAPLEVVAGRRTDGRPRQRGGRIARAETEVAGRLDRHQAKSSSPSTTMVPSSLGHTVAVDVAFPRAVLRVERDRDGLRGRRVADVQQHEAGIPGRGVHQVPVLGGGDVVHRPDVDAPKPSVRPVPRIHSLMWAVSTSGSVSRCGGRRCRSPPHRETQGPRR
jgi:hypothetical protein